MVRDAAVHLVDIRENCDAILSFVRGLDLRSYKGNDLVRSAVERRFIIIGEALSRINKLDLALVGAIPDAARIIAFRNVLVHGYESVSDELVWEIIEHHVPVLRSRCDMLLREVTND